MSFSRFVKTTLVCASFAVMAPSFASAVTIDFDGAADPAYQFDVDRTVNGNCASGSCLGLNTNEVSILSRVDGGTFSLTSLWFKLLGQTSDLLITATTSGASINYTQPVQTGTTVNFGIFTNVTSIIFSNIGKGNIRIDDINLTETVAPVPLPAGAGLLMAALGGLAMVRRRRAVK